MSREALEQVWKALSDPTRRGLLDNLKAGPRTTGDLAAKHQELSRFGVMKHMRVLEEAGLITVEAKGRERWNHLNAVPLRQLYERWVSGYADLWAESLVKLKESSETEEKRMKEIEISQQVEIAASPERVWTLMTDGIDGWWKHRFQEGSRVYLEPQLGGRFFEDFDGNEEGAIYATVTWLQKGKKLRMSGPMGMQGAVTGVIEYELEAQGSGTLLKLKHKAVGDVSEELQQGYSQGWTELLGTHLKKAAEAA